MEQQPETDGRDIEECDPLGDDDKIDAGLELARLRERMFGAVAEPIKIDRWIILEKVGTGGMGRVYAAYDPKLDRRVAIKQLLAHSSAQAKERFLREARAMAGISHEHVVHVYDVVTDDDRVHLVMEYIRGGTMRAWQADSATLAQILDGYVQAARGLARIHAEGLVHRDVKPDNIFVEDGGRVVIGDLGLARWTREAAEGAPGSSAESADAAAPSLALTEDGAILGTPGYMSPEQLRGDDADARSDQFSFCVSLYEAVYGVKPFAGTSVDEMTTAIEGRAFERGGERSRVAWMDAILRRGLSLDPGQRFADMGKLIRAIQRGRKQTMRRAGMSAMAVTGLALVWALQSGSQPGGAGDTCQDIVKSQFAAMWSDERQAGIRERRTAGGKVAGTMVWEQLSTEFGTAAEEWRELRLDTCDRSNEERESLAGTLVCLRDARSQLTGISNALAGSRQEPFDLWLLYKALRKVRMLDKGCVRWQKYKPGTAVTEDHAAGVGLDRVYEHLSGAVEQELMGELDPAANVGRVAVHEARESGNAVAQMHARYRLGHILGQQGKDKALEAVEQLANATALAEQEDLSWWKAEILVYWAKVAGDDLRDAKQGRELLAGVWELLTADDNAGVLTMDPGSMLLYADYLEATGLVEHADEKYDEAVKSHERAYHLRRLLAGTDRDIDVTKSLNNMANSLSRIEGKHDDAIGLYLRTLGLRREILKEEDHYLIAKVHYNLGAELSGKDNAKAREHLRTALTIREKLSGKFTSPVAEVWLAFGVLAYLNNNDSSLQEACTQLAKIHEKFAPDEMSEVVRVPELKLLAECSHRSGQTPGDIALLDRAIAILERNKDKSNEHAKDLAWTKGELGEWHLSLGAHAQGCQLLSTALTALEQYQWPKKVDVKAVNSMRSTYDTQRCQ